MWSELSRSGVMYYERQALQRVLVDRVRELGGEVLWGKKAVGFESVDEATRIAFGDGEDIGVDLLVGGYSSVRRFILEQKDASTAEERWLPDFMGMTGLYGVSEAPRSDSAMADSRDSHLIVLDQGCLATGPLPGGKTRWGLILPEATPPVVPPQVDESEPPDGTEAWQAKIVPGHHPLSSTVDILRQHFYAGTLDSLLHSADRIIRTSPPPTRLGR